MPLTGRADDGGVWVISQHGRRAGWAHNITANPKVRVRVNNEWRTGTAAFVPDDDVVARARSFGGKQQAQPVRHRARHARPAERPHLGAHHLHRLIAMVTMGACRYASSVPDLPGRDCPPGHNFPGYSNVHVAVQTKKRPPELLDLQPGDATEVTWTIDCEVNGSDVRGPYIQGRPGDRFIYLNWGSVDGDGRMDMFRRAKLMLDACPARCSRRPRSRDCSSAASGSPTPRANRCARRCGHR